MPSKYESSARADYVPALCTHRPSLLPIEWLSEAFGLAPGGWRQPPRAGKLVKLGHLEEVKVVTRLISRQDPSIGTLTEAFAVAFAADLNDFKQFSIVCKSVSLAT